MVKTLAEIITECKDGKMPEYDELRYAVVALDILLAQTNRDLRQASSLKSEFLRRFALQRSDEVKHIAYNNPPKEWLGEMYDPDNPDTQRRRNALRGVLTGRQWHE